MSCLDGTRLCSGRTCILIIINIYRHITRSKQSLKTHMQMHFNTNIAHDQARRSFRFGWLCFFFFNFCFFACVRCQCCCYAPVHFERVKKKKQRERKINKTKRMPTANGHSRLASMDMSTKIMFKSYYLIFAVVLFIENGISFGRCESA